jgi:hypothetical protein
MIGATVFLKKISRAACGGEEKKEERRAGNTPPDARVKGIKGRGLPSNAPPPDEHPYNA